MEPTVRLSQIKLVLDLKKITLFYSHQLILMKSSTEMRSNNN
jgi:hypothetical protein